MAKNLASVFMILPILGLALLGAVTDSFAFNTITEFLELRFSHINHMTVSSVGNILRLNPAASLAVFDPLVFVAGGIPETTCSFRELCE